MSVSFCPPSGSMPTDYELYYGFTRFAIELNELCPELKDVLPRTDARFRPDQRYKLHFLNSSEKCLQKHWCCFEMKSNRLIYFFTLRCIWSQRHLEEGNLEMATSEKQRIEDIQRTRRKWNEENNVKQEALFFKWVQWTHQQVHRFFSSSHSFKRMWNIDV